ncbi:MAG: UDP-galactose-4-epimerase [Candidatus Diapherotrites archaeon ADurb.Bin253]|nr:MAG: UDP-galactose-4-epimerase [Candidatus Diapherotrites archaeon ADurb.Bin253]HNZ52066.1 GDP-mannose 4,6-dehydratase [Candidatus Pacearchaeota archaeon]HPX74603.1 GDP-mannose 4,6-dehydratase [Candidatus Pacearchaeota archaeon]
MKKTILVTGAAGFIGFHTSKALLDRGDKVVGIDNLNSYYDPKLKLSRLDILKKYRNFKFYKQNIEDGIKIKEKIDVICHLAAQAGVRYSLENPFEYEKSNMLGTLTIFEFARNNKIKTIIYASSSSVYGNEKKVPFKESQKLDSPISLYAATKKANELYAYVYHHLFGINMTGLRFFTVYGPWGRPDMAIFKFTKNIIENKPIDVYNNGKMKRDFTYIDDVVSGILSSIDKGYAFEIFNLGRGKQEELINFIDEIERNVGNKVKRNLLPLQAGDVLETFADTTKARKLLNYKPKTSINEGIKNFVKWYKEYYQNNF